MPDGAMIIKEMIDPNQVELALVPGSNDLWIAPKPDQPADYYDQNFDGWTVMIKDARASADGWYYADFGREDHGGGNPPLYDRAGFATTPYPGSDGAPVTAPPPDSPWYPTFWKYASNDAQYPYYGFGSYCVYCHASAAGESTFSSFTNILGEELRYAWLPAKSAGAADETAASASVSEAVVSGVGDHDRRSSVAEREATTAEQGRAPFPSPRSDWLPGFRAAFPELDPAYEDVWAGRIPAQTWDHVPSQVGVAGVAPESSMFVTSNQCEGCHEAGGAGQLAQPHMVELTEQGQIDLSPWAEWDASPMGLAGRDPVFHAQLELERNIARTQPGLAELLPCIDNTCLHCHGGAGARQYNIDTAGQGPEGDPCAAFLPPQAQRAATHYDGKLFTQDMVFAWRDEQPELAKYGALAREGVSCTMCHRLADIDLDADNLAKTFTGNFRVGAPDQLFGPFPNQASEEAVRELPMKHSLGITPVRGAHVERSEMCGTCHTVFLPVFDDAGALAGTAYEQTTYLEWLLSDFSGDPSAGSASAQSCQDCHMPRGFHGKQMKTGVANIQDTRYPAADFLLPAAEVDVPERPYNRHSLYGLNAFLNAYFQQFPLLLGYRQQDFMNAKVRAPLLTARESVLEVARTQTATLALGAPSWRGEVLETQVTVSNLGGHNLPSGVGFRRLFIEFLVLDEAGEALWASGRTNEIGVLLAGTSERPLATELEQVGADGLPFQPHHQVIADGAQAQIYEEVVQNSSYGFTSSFIHRYWELKDNRLRPRGWNPARVSDAERREEYGSATRPGHGPERHWWPEPDKAERYADPRFPAIAGYTDTQGDPDYELAEHGAEGLPGSDTLRYRVALPAELRARVASVRVTLYSQSTPPSYLKERFAHAAKPGNERRDADRLYYLAGHLNTEATADDGQPYLSGYKLRVGAAAERAVSQP
ncbi:hypothetical protein [Haliangium ochraceum]|uniref:Cytochrome c-552/4 domain-containing protein n=1 Tax=Haliangium ochraceum (strain DSM 14365 / JCM 11303 / SMP-2) TaxID=502025 RepID=D0LYV7_HALO1|nr:hypothetical protein [Haliangium ochraceum]ACY14427.1 conserved hypothetical protein [Haliangium ochraceum DSM 14365]